MNPRHQPIMQPELDFEFYVPAGREAFRVWEVANILRHSEDQVIDLIEEGCFGPVVDCARPGSSRSSLIVTRAGLLKFLKEKKR